MCTVSVVPNAGGYRLVCNRDELRTRPIGLPPRVARTRTVTALWPVDPMSGGTWIGVNDAGLTLVLLNRTGTDARSKPAARISRGTIIPQLIDCSSLGEAIQRAMTLSLGEIDAFTLVLVKGSAFGTVTRINSGLSVRTRALHSPVCFTSSSLGDGAVEKPRGELFEMLVRSNAHPLDGQAHFHRHRWPSRPEISVQMCRADALTVSRTVVDVMPGRFAIRYTALQ